MNIVSKVFLVLIYIGLYFVQIGKTFGGLKILEYYVSTNVNYLKANISGENDSYDMDIHVFKKVNNPSLHILFLERTKKTTKKWHEKSYEMCDLKIHIGRSPMAYLVNEVIRKTSNLTLLSCSYSPGFYAIRNFRPGSNGMPMAFLYKPNALLIANMTLFINGEEKGILMMGGAFKALKILY